MKTDRETERDRERERERGEKERRRGIWRKMMEQGEIKGL